MRLQYMSIILNFLLLKYMDNVPEDKIEQELLLLINTPPTLELNNNISELKVELGKIKKNKNKTKRKKHKKEKLKESKNRYKI